MPAPVNSAREAAPAKINLTLHITGRRPDGYHLLDSLVVFTTFGDLIEVSPASRDGFAVDGNFSAGIPTDATNLVLRARDALREAATGPVSIHLTKNLPIASGVGGGSSDAAATLRALNRLWGIDHSPARLAEIGLALGADLPMCLAASPLIAQGIGETLQPLSPFPALDMVLVNPGVAVSTPAVFKTLATADNPPLPLLPPRLDFDTLLAWLGQTRNDLEAPARALAPAIGEALAALTSQGAAFARMSGSGATCFGLFPSTAKAQDAASAIRTSRPGWFVTATQTGPA